MFRKIRQENREASEAWDGVGGEYPQGDQAVGRYSSRVERVDHSHGRVHWRAYYDPRGKLRGSWIGES